MKSRFAERSFRLEGGNLFQLLKRALVAVLKSQGKGHNEQVDCFYRYHRHHQRKLCSGPGYVLRGAGIAQW